MDNDFSKQSIKNRMFRRVAALWEVRNIENLDPTVISELDTRCVWLKAEFPAHFTKDIIESINVNINAFPIANKHIRKTEKAINVTSSIVPLDKSSNQYLLGVESVVDAGNKSYRELQFSGDDATNTGIYSTRRGGAERFNPIDAAEYLTRLIDLLRDESMAFANVDKDSIGANAIDLLKQINEFEYKSKIDGEAEKTSYLIFDHQGIDDHMMFISYWLSDGVVGNGIKSGETLKSDDDYDVDRSSVILLTTTKGGSPAPSQARQLDMYKFALVSHGSIYSREDIRSYCNAVYGDFVKDVEIKRGYAHSDVPGQGVVRTIDVCMNAVKPLTPPNKSRLIEQMLGNLNHISPDDFNYRIFINS